MSKLFSLSELISNNQTTSFTYDLLSRITQTTYPDGSKENYNYDKEGNFARFTYATDRTPIQMDYKEKSETINRYNREAQGDSISRYSYAKYGKNKCF